MNNRSLLLSLVLGIAATGMLSCGKTESVSTPAAPTSYSEGFDTMSRAISRGWVVANNSRPIGTMPWVQGFFYLSQHHEYDGKLGATNTYQFDGFGGMHFAQSGTDFAMATNNSGHGKAVISNWLISPVLSLKNGDRISFYTRTYANPATAADRLQVRLNPVNSSSEVGRDATSTGNFSEVLLDINSTYQLEGDDSYPGDWTLYEATVTGMPGSTAKKTRIAFRYFVEDGGPEGNNSVGIGIDNFNVTFVN